MNSQQDVQTLTGYSVSRGNSERLTSSELANLWASYLDNDIKIRVVKYLLQVVEDKDIKQVFKQALRMAEEHLKKITTIYKKENHPIPHGLSDEDVDLNAPKLFSDEFALSILQSIAESRVEGYGTALTMSARPDVLEFFYESLNDPASVLKRTIELAISKGFYMRPPQIPIPKKPEVAKSQNFITGFFGKKRPLTAIEISHIFSGLNKNLYRKTLFSGFSQIAENDEVRRYMERGKEIASKHMKIFAQTLTENNFPVSMDWNSAIVGSNTTPFSDKLIMLYVRVTNVIQSNNYGKALTVAGTKRDLAIDFARLTLEVLKYAEDGINIQIKHGWFEEPPQASGEYRQIH
ncbi:MAG: DUF3231 family protein [Desulfotomaculaceae bacterium]|nr:DUF3231 family protein [Desulfotomaculaceae bacterium]